MTVAFSDNGMQFADGTVMDSAVKLGTRNKLINGDFNIWQRGTPISSIAANGSTVTYTADRWCLVPAATGWTAVAQALQVTGGGLRVNCTTAAAYNGTTSDGFAIQQRIEGFNAAPLAGKQITVSFKVKTNKLGNYGVVLYDGTGATFGTPQSITVTQADTIVRYTLTFAAPANITSDNADRLRLHITLGAQTARAGTYYPTAGSQVNLLDNVTNYFELTEAQLEEGSVATPFERRPYGMELALCQRYYYRVQSNNTSYIFGPGCATSATAGNFTGQFPVTMRTSPTALEQNGTASHYTVQTGGVDRASSSVVAHWGVTSREAWGVTTTVASGQTAGQAGFLYAQNATAYLGWSAEL